MRTTGSRFLDVLRMRWRALVDRRRLDRDLTDELQFHLDSLVEQFQSQGLGRREALRRARLEMGGPTQIAEATRDQRGWRRLDLFLLDTRHAFRTFRKFPGFTVTAVLTITLGMGANTALFTVMHGLLFRPLPIRDPGPVANVYLEVETERRAGYGSRYFVSFVEFEALRRDARTAAIAGIAETELSWRGIASRSVQAQLVSANLLDLIGARPALGRFFATPEVATPGSSPVVVLSDGLWRRDLGADPDIVGKTLVLNRTTFTVIGVADPATRGPLIQTADLWIPLTMQRITRPGESLIDEPTAGWIQTFARPHPGATLRELANEMAVLGPRAVASHDDKARVRSIVTPASFFNTPQFRRDAFPVFTLVWAAVSLILVVACANVANMLLARGLSRRREIAVRLALGAPRRRVIGQLLTESAWLGALGGLGGLALAVILGRFIPALIPGGRTIQLPLSPDGAVLAFTGGVAIAAGLVFGLLPALWTTRLDLTNGLRSEGLVEAGRSRVGPQRALVALQVTASVVLLVIAGLLVRSFATALTMDVGKPLNHLVITRFDLRQQQYTAERAETFVHTLIERLAADPAVVASGISLLDPELSSATNVIALGDSVPADANVQVTFDEVDAGYFAAAGLPLLAGRTFTDQEVRARLPVMVVDQRFADRHFGGRAVGQRLWLGDGQGRRLHEIVGVVGSTRPLGMGAELLPTYFVPLVGLRFMEAKLWVRYRGEAAPVLASIRTAAEAIDPDVMVRTRPIEDNVREALLPLRMLTASLTALGILALSLASVGLFGVIAFAVGRRSREIAIRMAVGAQPGQVVSLIVRDGFRPVLIGLFAGLTLAVGAGQLIRSALYGVSPFDPVAATGVAALVTLAAGAAFAVPVRRATAVRPSQLLRID